MLRSIRRSVVCAALVALLTLTGMVLPMATVRADDYTSYWQQQTNQTYQQDYTAYWQNQQAQQ
jgi:hypothetical protein